MYGFSGYGTNAYGSKRISLIPPIVRKAMLYLRLKFRNLTLGL
jgi:hypothetical protein